MAVVYRSVLQRYQPDPEISELLETFRMMVNDCLRLGLKEDVRDFSSVKRLCYQRMMEYEVENSYRVSAMFEASNLLKKYHTDSRRTSPSPPYCRRRFLSASVGVNVENETLALPDRRRVRLNPHTLKVLSRPGVEPVSVTITPDNLGIVYREEVPEMRISGAVALDINLDNVTTFDTDGRAAVHRMDALVEIHEKYRRITSRFRRRDNRIKRAIFRKHAAIKWRRRNGLLHLVSSTIVNSARSRRQAIIMEDLKGVRGMFRRESRSSKGYLSKINAWPFAELQRQIEYKAKWAGLPVIYVDPAGSSNECSRCGGGMKESAGDYKTVSCTVCGLVIDRDLNAAKNLLSRGMRFVPVWPADEAMKGPQARESEPKARVDADQPSRREGGATESEHS